MCWSLGYLDLLGKGSLEEKVFVTLWGLGQRGKGDHGRFLPTEMDMKLGLLDPRNCRRNVGLPSTSWVSRGCLEELGLRQSNK